MCKPRQGRHRVAHGVSRGLPARIQPSPGRGERTIFDMAHTFTNLMAHVIFSTKDRLPLIQPALRPDLHAYLGGIMRELGGRATAVGGTADRVHVLLSAPVDRSLAEIVRVMKANSARWVNKTRPAKTFAWQTGYGAFSVSQSNVRALVQYVQNQEEHHRRVTFQEEYLAFLRKNGIAYDERFLWG